MLLPSQRIEKAVGDMNNAPCLAHVHVNAAKKRLEASNGKILAVVPVDTEDGEKLDDELLPVETLAGSRKSKMKRPRRLFSHNGNHMDADLKPYKKSDLKDFHFPDCDEVLPKSLENRPPDLVISPELLYSLYQAISTGTDRLKGMSLWFTRRANGTFDFETAIYAEARDGSGAYGVIMPQCKGRNIAGKDAVIPGPIVLKRDQEASHVDG